MNQLIRLLCILLIASGCWQSHAKTITFDDSVQDFSITSDQVQLFEDTSTLLNFQEVRKQTFEEAASSYPMNTNLASAYWIKFEIEGNSSSLRKWVIEVFDLHIDDLQLYLPLEDGSYLVKKVGYRLPFKQREYQHYNYVFDLDIDFEGNRTVYARVKSIRPVGLIFQIRSNNYFSYYAINEHYFLGLFYGIIAIMAVYNLLLFFSTFEKVYLLYVLYVLAVGLNSMLEDGTGFSYIWSNHPEFSYIGGKFSRLLFVVSFALYARSFLKIKDYLPKIDKILLYCTGGYVLFYGLHLYIGTGALNDILFVSFFLSVYVLAWYVYRKNYKPARYFIIGYSLMIISVIIVNLRDRGVIHTPQDDDLSIFIVYALNIGAVIEIVILSLALGDRIRFLKLEHEQAQMHIIDQLRENDKLKDKVNRELEGKVLERTKELNEKNKSIMESLDYARRIQNAVLPDNNSLDEDIGKNFLIYHPRDIVSGDFYWVQQIKEGTIIAVGDCTGHGVPGAFMSIMAHNLLHHAVLEKGLSSPADILKVMDEKLKERLHSSDEFDDQHGMDISVVLLDTSKQKLSFAGAFNPLWIVHDGKLEEHRANRYPVGHYFMEPDNKAFDLVEVRLHKGDRFFMFSDGFADQFGGPEKDKFMKENFQSLLRETSGLPIEEQSANVESTFLNWKGDNEQIDDVIVLGVEV